MKYYVIINGESSLDIQGLAIESLPAISKPLMRSKREEIDGRNGDIITQLGYGAYDKTLKIGLWGDYDINEVITFFNQEGTITFSNETDMYYNFTILNRIDFINQLEAFRKATITIHCQPFKYKEEETEELEIITKEVSGTDISVNDAVDGAMNITLKGNTSQVQLSGKNLCGIPNQTFTFNGVDITIQDGEITLNGTTTGIGNTQIDAILPTILNGSYVNNFIYVSGSVSQSNNGNFNVRNINGTVISGSQLMLNTNNSNASLYFSSDTSIKYGIYFQNTGITFTNYKFKVQLIKGTTLDYNYEQYCGGTPSPNPSYPQDIHNVSGNNTIYVRNKNLKSEGTIYNLYFNATTFSMSNRTLCIPIEANTTYYIKKPILSNRFRVCLSNAVPSTSTTVNEYQDVSSLTETSITNTNYTYLNIFFWQNSDTYTEQELYDCLNIYTQETTYPINLPSGMELCKIGTYQDYFYKENDKWYLHKEIDKYVYDGSGTITNTETNYYNVNNLTIGIYVNTLLSMNYIDNKYITKPIYSSDSDFRNNTTNDNYAMGLHPNRKTIRIKDVRGLSNDDFKNDLIGLTIYYALATPTNTEITDTTLIEQLEAIKSANSYYGTTNINQVNNDMPFILDVSYLSGTNNITITNHGNYYSKPKLTINGTGNIGIYLNDSQIFQVALGTDETIIIDTDKMEAYYESTLKNRQVIGDYNSFKLLSGENTIRISGTFSKLQVDNYSRWI